jgi:hypothetical protein
MIISPLIFTQEQLLKILSSAFKEFIFGKLQIRLKHFLI